MTSRPPTTSRGFSTFSVMLFSLFRLGRRRRDLARAGVDNPASRARARVLIAEAAPLAGFYIMPSRCITVLITRTFSFFLDATNVSILKLKFQVPVAKLE